MNDDLEIYIAAGLDIPTSIVLSEDRQVPPKKKNKTVFLVVFIVIVVILILLR
jgi:hypothetical protein